MSVHKVATSASGTRWVVRWRDPNGRAKEQWFDRKAGADAFARRIGHARDVGRYRDPKLERVTFGQWYRRWWLVVESSGRSRNTLVNYESVGRLHVLPYLGDKRLSAIQRIDIDEWLAALRAKGLGDSSIRTARAVAGMVFGSAVESGVVDRNPMSGLRLARPKTSRVRALDVDQVEALVEATPTAYQVFTLVLAYGGLRPGEAAALQRRHFDDLGQLLVEQGQTEAHGHLVIGPTKTHRRRVVPLPPSVAKALTEHLKGRPDDPDAPIFTIAGGAALRLSSFRRIFDRAREATGLPDWVTP